MDILRAIALGILQGATEFIPVSSSGHLVLVPWLLGWQEPGLVFGVTVHWGTLVAVLIYFRTEWQQLLTAGWHAVTRWDWRDPRGRLAWLIVLGSIPAAGAGFLFEGFFEALFAKPAWVSFFLLVTALVLILSEKLGHQDRELSALSWRGAVLVGLGQAAAIAPGISRSGATIAAGLIYGLPRRQAARFSFLLATPVILGAGVFKMLELLVLDDPAANLPALAAGFVAAVLSGYVCIWGLLRYLERGKLYAFAAYCALAGVAGLVMAWAR